MAGSKKYWDGMTSRGIYESASKDFKKKVYGIRDAWLNAGHPWDELWFLMAEISKQALGKSPSEYTEPKGGEQRKFFETYNSLYNDYRKGVRYDDESKAKSRGSGATSEVKPEVSGKGVDALEKALGLSDADLMSDEEIYRPMTADDLKKAGVTNEEWEAWKKLKSDGGMPEEMVLDLLVDAKKAGNFDTNNLEGKPSGKKSSEGVEKPNGGSKGSLSEAEAQAAADEAFAEARGEGDWYFDGIEDDYGDNPVDYLDDYSGYFGLSEDEAAAQAAADEAANERRYVDAIVGAVDKASGGGGLEAKSEAPKDRPTYHLRVTTTDKGGRAQFGEGARAPHANWKIELIDDQTGKPIKMKDAEGNDVDSLDYSGHPLLGYLRIRQSLIPRLSEFIPEEAVLRGNIEGVVNRYSGSRNRIENAKQRAEKDIKSLIPKIKGSKLEAAFTGSKGNITQGSIIKGMNAVVNSILKGGDYTLDKWGNLISSSYDSAKKPDKKLKKEWLERVASELGKKVGVDSGYMEKIIKDSLYLTKVYPDVSSRQEDSERRDAFRSEQLSEALSHSGNFNSLHGYIINLFHKPKVKKFRDGQPVQRLDWSKRYNDISMVDEFGDVIPMVDVPYLDVNSDETKALIAKATDKNGKVDMDRLAKLLQKENEGILGLKDRSLATSGKNVPVNAGDIITVTTPYGEEAAIPGLSLITKYPSSIGRSILNLWRRYFRPIKEGDRKYAAKNAGVLSSRAMGKEDSKAVLNQHNVVLGNLRQLLSEMDTPEAVEFGKRLDEEFRKNPGDDEPLSEEELKRVSAQIDKLANADVRRLSRGRGYSPLLSMFGSEYENIEKLVRGQLGVPRPEYRDVWLAKYGDAYGVQDPKNPKHIVWPSSFRQKIVASDDERARGITSSDKLKYWLLRTLTEMVVDNPEVSNRESKFSSFNFPALASRFKRELGRVKEEQKAIEAKEKAWEEAGAGGKINLESLKARDADLARLKAEKEALEGREHDLIDKLTSMDELQGELYDRLIAHLAGRYSENVNFDPETGTYRFGAAPYEPEATRTYVGPVTFSDASPLPSQASDDPYWVSIDPSTGEVSKESLATKEAPAEDNSKPLNTHAGNYEINNPIPEQVQEFAKNASDIKRRKGVIVRARKKLNQAVRGDSSVFEGVWSPETSSDRDLVSAVQDAEAAVARWQKLVDPLQEQINNNKAEIESITPRVAELEEQAKSLDREADGEAYNAVLNEWKELNSRRTRLQEATSVLEEELGGLKKNLDERTQAYSRLVSTLPEGMLQKIHDWLNYTIPEESAAEEPVAEEPAAEEPVAEEPVAEEPSLKEQIAAINPDEEGISDLERSYRLSKLSWLKELYDDPIAFAQENPVSDVEGGWWAPFGYGGYRYSLEGRSPEDVAKLNEAFKEWVEAKADKYSVRTAIRNSANYAKNPDAFWKRVREADRTRQNELITQFFGSDIYKKHFGTRSDKRIKNVKGGTVSDKKKKNSVSVGWVASALADGPFKYLG